MTSTVNDAGTAPAPAVRADYRQIEKLVEPDRDRGTGLKWYDIRAESERIDDEIRAQAQRIADSSVPGSGGEPGFVLLHLCSGSAYYLSVCSWRNNNELWHTAFIRPGGGGNANRGFGLVEGAATHGTFCVWELGPVGHEQQAWTRYLNSTRDAAALESYRQDTFRGRV